MSGSTRGIDDKSSDMLNTLSRFMIEKEKGHTAKFYENFLRLLVEWCQTDLLHTNLQIERTKTFVFFFLHCPIDLLLPQGLGELSRDQKVHIYLTDIFSILTEYLSAESKGGITSSKDNGTRLNIESLFSRLFLILSNFFAWQLSSAVKFLHSDPDQAVDILQSRLAADITLDRIHTDQAICTSSGKAIRLSEDLSSLIIMSMAQSVSKTLVENKGAHSVQNHLKLECHRQATRCGWASITRSVIELIITSGFSSIATSADNSPSFSRSAASASFTATPTKSSTPASSRKNTKELDSLTRVTKTSTQQKASPQPVTPISRPFQLGSTPRTVDDDRDRRSTVNAVVPAVTDDFIPEPPVVVTEMNATKSTPASAEKTSAEVWKSSSNEIAKKFGVLF